MVRGLLFLGIDFFHRKGAKALSFFKVLEFWRMGFGAWALELNAEARRTRRFF